MEKFRRYFLSLPQPDREQLAEKCEVNWMHLRNIAYGIRRANPKLASQLEQATGGQVTRRDLFPDDWHIIWPELT